MRAPRIHVDSELRPGEQLLLPAPAARYSAQVLRLRSGDPLVLFNGNGRDYPAEVEHMERGTISVRIGAPGEVESVAPLWVHLGIGISKGERMDFALQKSVELGVSCITPLFTERSVVRLAADRLKKREAHWRAVVISACEQSGRRRIPQLHQAHSLAAWLSDDHPFPLLLDHRAQAALPSLAPAGNRLTLLIGPEGGLAPVERSHARTAGFTGVRLGPRILRTETAPLAALAAVQVLWGDLGK